MAPSSLPRSGASNEPRAIQEETSDDACYRAMDWLLEVEADLAEQVYWQTASLLDLEVDLVFFDTTSTYWQTEQPDPAWTDDAGQTHERRVVQF